MKKSSKLLLLILIALLSLLFSLFIFFRFEERKSITSEILSYKEDLANTISDVQSCGYSESLSYVSYSNSNWEKNNKFGLYIYAEDKDFFDLAKKLVNSNGGDWGYVLIPYNVKDRDLDKWMRVFELLQSRHLIPIIQLWDVNVDNYKEQTEDAAAFLNKFFWPIKPRYISVYNEPNDRKFWYGDINPAQYAKILNFTIDTFKKENSNFFVMNGAFNISAETNANHLDALEYMFQMNEAIPGIFNKLDGWASHSYPQPNFSGDPYDTGRNSIKAYDVELSYLKRNFSVTKDLPVFITETGWAHSEGSDFDNSFYDAKTIGSFFKKAFDDVWLKDDRVRAVTPFTVIYEHPFDHFSWVNEDKVPYAQYDAVKSLKKIAGDPPSLEQKSMKVAGCSNE